jgi:hypothetical protein
MKAKLPPRLRHVLPWLVSAGLLAYVFGWATDWQRLLAAIEQANGPLFVAFASADRLGFFLIWTWLQALAIRRFVVHVPYRSVIAMRGGSELLRAVSNPLSDAAFFLGLIELAGGRALAVIAASMVPVAMHFVVMLLQMTLALPFLEGGITESRDVLTAVGVMWLIVLASAIALRISRNREKPLPGMAGLQTWLGQFSLRDLRPFFWSFVGLAIFDVVIQWAASRAFGVPISWGAMTARLPLVYLAFIVPTLGNFGTRELAWAALFSEFGPRDSLLAYAFAVNAIFLILNVALGLVFLRQALELVSRMRQARREGEPVPKPLLHDPTDL